jgi:hypothetical protein
MPTPKRELVPPPFPNLAPSARDQDIAVAVETDDHAIANSPVDKGSDNPDTDGEQFEDAREAPEAEDEEEQEEGEEKLVSVSHVLTNVILLQEFLLELAALVQVRAGLFGEVKFV